MADNIRIIENAENPQEFHRLTQDSKATPKSSTTEGNGSNTMFGWMFAAPGDDAPRKSEELKAKERDEELKRETYMSSTLRSIRNKFVDRQLSGRIALSSTVSSLVTTAYYLSVSEGEKHSYVDGNDPNSEKPEIVQHLSAEENRALSMTDTILNSLERRSLAWEGINFADGLLLARGASLGVTVPIFTFLTFDISIELCATVKTLLASHKRHEKRLLLEAKRDLFVNKYTPSYSLASAVNNILDEQIDDEDEEGNEESPPKEVEFVEMHKIHQTDGNVGSALPVAVNAVSSIDNTTSKTSSSSSTVSDLFGWGKSMASKALSTAQQIASTTTTPAISNNSSSSTAVSSSSSQQQQQTAGGVKVVSPHETIIVTTPQTSHNNSAETTTANISGSSEVHHVKSASSEGTDKKFTILEEVTGKSFAAEAPSNTISTDSHSTASHPPPVITIDPFMATITTPLSSPPPPAAPSLPLLSVVITSPAVAEYNRKKVPVKQDVVFPSIDDIDPYA